MKTKAEIEAELLAATPIEKWTESMGKLNAYQCNKCRSVLVVVLLDWGTTPFMLGCAEAGRFVATPPGTKRDRYCKGDMTSGFYRIDHVWATYLTHGFYRPDDTGPAMVVEMERIELKGKRHGASADSIESVRRETIAHVERGGLLLRELNVEERGHWRKRFGFYSL